MQGLYHVFFDCRFICSCVSKSNADAIVNILEKDERERQKLEEQRVVKALENYEITKKLRN